MKIKKAIKLLTLYLKDPCPAQLHELDDAIALGIEALKALLAIRKYPQESIGRKLKGE